MTNEWSSRYSQDVLSSPAVTRKALKEVPATLGLVVEDVESGWVGAVVRTEHIGAVRVVVLEDRKGRCRSFELGTGFWVDGEPVNLVRDLAVTKTVSTPTVSASGSRVVADTPARVARGSRIWVEGTHDAELVERIWGHDLRVEGIVVEPLGGIDDLAAHVADFGPSASSRLGILVDHMVAGSKETRIAQETLQRVPGSRYVQIVGHPYVDVWQAVKPARLGLRAWPTVDRSVEWKDGILQALGWPHGTVEARALGWKKILGSVQSYSDLEASFLGRVEELIDFVTLPAGQE